jgi:hypothetical protein
MAVNDRVSMERFTYQLDRKEYTQAEINAATQQANKRFHKAGLNNPNVRIIPIETLEKGVLLFHYFRIPTRNVGENDINYASRVFDTLMGQFGIPISWNIPLQRFEFCFGSVTANPHYYYPNPSAGFGIAGFGDEFNAGLICVTQRPSRWAYLKSGTTVNNTRAVHRKVPISHQETSNYDYLRLKLCDEINTRGRCRDGNNYDICLTARYQREQALDGVTAIAQMDDLMDIRRHNEGPHTFDTNKTMLRAMQSWFRKIQENNNQQMDRLLWAMNLLCLETDLKNQTLNVGFREFACSPFGSTQVEHERIPPAVLPAATYGAVGGNYGVIQEELNAAGNCVLRRFWIRNNGNHFLEFLNQYIVPNLLIKPVALVTPNSIRQSDVNINFLIPNPPPDAVNMEIVVAEDARYNLNHRIATWFDTKVAEETNIGFDLLHNVFYLKNETLNEIINIEFTFNPAHAGVNYGGSVILPAGAPQTRRGYQKNQYIKNFSYASMNDLQLMKINKELLTNKKWQHWMAEYLVLIKQASVVPIPIGPFYNPLSLPIINYNDMRGNYARIIEHLESGLILPIFPIQHSISHDVLNNVINPAFNNYRIYMDSILNLDPNTAAIQSINGIIPFRIGQWFRDIAGQRAVFVHAQEGGGETIQFSKTFKTNLRKNLKNKNVSKNKSNNVNKNNVNKNNVSKNNVNKNNVNKNNVNKNNVSKNNVSKNNSKNKTRKNINKNTNSLQNEEGHTSANITGVTKDQEYILDYIQKDKNFGPVWKLLFVNENEFIGNIQQKNNVLNEDFIMNRNR